MLILIILKSVLDSGAVAYRQKGTGKNLSRDCNSSRLSLLMGFVCFDFLVNYAEFSFNYGI